MYCGRIHPSFTLTSIDHGHRATPGARLRGKPSCILNFDVTVSVSNLHSVSTDVNSRPGTAHIVSALVRIIGAGLAGSEAALAVCPARHQCRTLRNATAAIDSCSPDWKLC